MLLYFLFLVNLSFTINNNINKKSIEKKFLLLSDFYITINPQIHNQDNGNYSSHVIQWLLEIKQILGILLKKYENNTENKIQLEKFRNVFFDCICYILMITNNNIFSINVINYNIFQYLHQKIFPCIKKINKIIHKSYDKVEIKNNYDLKNYIFSGLLRLKPLNLNNYGINIYLIENTNNPQLFIKNAKDFVFFLKNLLQSIVEIAKNDIIPQDYKQIQNIINKLSKLMDTFAKLLLLESLNNINILSYKKEIEILVQNINEIFKRTHSISLYKIYKKFNSNINNNNNCIEYIPGFFHSKDKKYYQILYLNNDYFFIKKYKIQMKYENHKIEDLINILKIIQTNTKIPFIKEKIKNIFNIYQSQLDMEKKLLLRDKFVKESLQKKKIEDELENKKNKEEKLIKLNKFNENKTELEKITKIIDKKYEEVSIIKKSKDEIFENKKKIQQEYEVLKKEINENIQKYQENIKNYPITFFYSWDFLSMVEENYIPEISEINLINCINEEIYGELSKKIQNNINKQEDLKKQLDIFENSLKDKETIINQNNLVIKELESKNNSIMEENHQLDIAINHIVEKPHINYQQEFIQQFNKINNINHQENKGLYHDENSFYNFIDAINYILLNSDLNIIYFYEYIYENPLLLPLIKDDIKNYYIQYTDPESNKNFLEILIKNIKNNNIKNDFNKIINNLKTIIQKINNIKNNNKILSNIENYQNQLEKDTKNYNHNNILIKKYMVFTNRQLKKISNLNNNYNLPNNINKENFSQVQNIIYNLSNEDLKVLYENEIILMTINKFKIIQEIKKEYKKIFSMVFLSELININFKINNLLKNISLPTEDFSNFIVNYNDYNFLYNYLKIPLLNKK